MKNTIVKLIFSFLALLVISCTSTETERATVVSDVYVAGSKANHATFWKNSVLQSLTDVGFVSSRADTLLVKNNDIHILGTGKVGGNEKTLYWKNNVLTNLTDTFSTSTEIATISSMDVDSNNDVYFVGMTKNITVTPNTYKLVYWKNGVQYIVDSLTYATCQNTIKVVNNSVYISIAYLTATQNLTGYYINNVYYPSADYIWGVTCSSSDVYTYGRSNTMTGAYYKNISTNSLTNLVSPTNYGEILPIYKMCFDSGDIFACNGSYVYKNGAIIYTTPLPTAPFVTSGNKDMDVKNSSLYILNEQGDINGNVAQIVLKDGMLLIQNATDERFNSLFVN